MSDLPETIKYDMQPYTYGAILTDLEWVETCGYTALRGTVVEGSERAYLFGQSAAKDIAGRTVHIYGVKEHEIARGHIVRVAS